MTRAAEQLREEGFAIFEQLVPAASIDKHLLAYECRLATLQREDPDQDPHVETARRKHLDVVEYGLQSDTPLALCSELRSCMQAVFGQEPILSFTRTGLWEAGNRAAHFDTSMQSTVPGDQVYRTWCALEDIGPDSGNLYVVPGTHATLPEEVCTAVLKYPGVREALELVEAEYLALGKDRAAVETRQQWRHFHALSWPLICQEVQKRVAGLPRRSFTPKKGDVIVFSPRVVHGTMPRSSLEQTRKCQISEWRGRRARDFSVTEFFGPDYDKREQAGAGQPADRGAVESSWGAYVPPRY